MRYIIVTTAGTIFCVAAKDMRCDPMNVMQYPGNQGAIGFMDGDRQILINRQHIVSMFVEKV